MEHSNNETFKWQDPPARKRGSGGRPRNAERAENIRRLVDRPNTWACIFSGKQSTASGIRRVLIKGAYEDLLPGGRVEATTRKNDDGSVSVYARFVPEV